MTKYKEYFLKMAEENKELFENFKKIHAEYDLKGDSIQEQFNKEGEKILTVIHEWENRLCKTSEGAGFGTFTANLAEKFQAEVKLAFPLIDHVGIIVKPFTLKKIKL